MKNYLLKQKNILQFKNVVSNNSSITSVIKTLKLTDSKSNRDNIKTTILKMLNTMTHQQIADKLGVNRATISLHIKNKL